MDLTDKLITQIIDGSGYESRDGVSRVTLIKWIAVNPSTTEQTLSILSNHVETDVLERVAENENTPGDVMAQLAMHPMPQVRAAVADNPRAPKDLLIQLAHDESADVRYQVAENSRIPRFVIEALVEDDNPYVAHRAAETLYRISENDGQGTGVVERIRKWFASGEEKRRQRLA